MLPPLDELLGDLAEEYERQGRTDEALAVMGEAIEAGYRGQPDPQCWHGRTWIRARKRQLGGFPPQWTGSRRIPR